MHAYDLTLHAESGLVCADCHLRIAEGEMGGGHGERVHSFAVTIDTCSECHFDDLHSSDESNSATIRSLIFESETGANSSQSLLQAEPSKVSPTGFTILGTLFGVGAGMIMAPWLEKWFQRFRN